MMVAQTKKQTQRNSAVPRRTHEKKRISKNPDELDVELPLLSELIASQFKHVFCEKSPYYLDY